MLSTENKYSIKKSFAKLFLVIGSVYLKMRNIIMNPPDLLCGVMI